MCERKRGHANEKEESEKSKMAVCTRYTIVCARIRWKKSKTESALSVPCASPSVPSDQLVRLAESLSSSSRETFEFTITCFIILSLCKHIIFCVCLSLCLPLCLVVSLPHSASLVGECLSVPLETFDQWTVIWFIDDGPRR